MSDQIEKEKSNDKTATTSKTSNLTTKSLDEPIDTQKIENGSTGGILKNATTKIKKKNSNVNITQQNIEKTNTVTIVSKSCMTLEGSQENLESNAPTKQVKKSKITEQEVVKDNINHQNNQNNLNQQNNSQHDRIIEDEHADHLSDNRSKNEKQEKQEKNEEVNYDITRSYKKASLTLQIDELSAHRMIQLNKELNSLPNEVNIKYKEGKHDKEKNPSQIIDVIKEKSSGIELEKEISSEINISQINKINKDKSLISEGHGINNDTFLSKQELLKSQIREVNIPTKNDKHDKHDKYEEKEKNDETFKEHSVQNSTIGLTYNINQKSEKLQKSKQTNNKTQYKNLSNLKNIDYQRYMFKVILLGNIAVGKTCLLSYFVESIFKQEYTCTVGVDFKIKTVHLMPNKKVDLQIWDTSGEERFKTITRQYYRDAAGIVLIFDVTNEKSFVDVVHWIEDIKLCAKNNVSIVLVGNKADLEDHRVISYKTAHQYAVSNGLQYYETSAKTGLFVSEMFEELAQIMTNVYDIETIKKKNEKRSDSFYINKGEMIDNLAEDNQDNNSSYVRKNQKKNCC